jgi:hypothetical protein
MAQRASLHLAHMLWAALLMPAVGRGQVITCSTSAIERKVRAEGLTELLGDIEAQCTLSRPGSIGAYLTADVTLCMNTFLTNVRGFRSAPDLTDAVLIVNENHAPPADSSTLGGPQGNVPVPQYGKGFSVNDRCDPGEALSPVRAPNALKWSGVRIPVPGADAGNGRLFPDPVTLRVTNMRVNANALGIGASGSPALIFAKAFTITDSTGVPGLDPLLALAEVNRGFSVSVRSASGAGLARGMQCQSQNITGVVVTGSPSFFVHVQELLPDTLRRLGLPATLFRTSSGEDGYPTPGVGANGGGATQGTRVAITFSIFRPAPASPYQSASRPAAWFCSSPRPTAALAHSLHARATGCRCSM